MGLNLTKYLALGAKRLYLLNYIDVFCLHAKLYDAAGAVWSHSGEGPGYCYVFGRGPNSWVPGHKTGLLFCLYVKPFRRSIFTSVDFRNSLSCDVLNIELADQNFSRKLAVLLMEMFKETHLVLKERTNPEHKQFGVNETCTKLDVRITLRHAAFFLEMWSVITLQREHKIASFLAKWWIKRWQFWLIRAAPKLKIMLMWNQMDKRWLAQVTHSDLRPHFTAQSARQFCCVSGQGCIWCHNFCKVKYIVSICVTESFKMFQLFSEIEYYRRFMKRHHVAKFQIEVRVLFLSEKNTLAARRDPLASKRGLHLKEVINPPFNSRLSWKGAICSFPGFGVQQYFRKPVSYEAEISKVSSFTKPTYQTESFKKKINKNLFAKADFLVEKNCLVHVSISQFAAFNFW